MRGFIVRADQSAAGAFVVAERHNAPASVATTKIDADFMLSPFIARTPNRPSWPLHRVALDARSGVRPHGLRFCSAAIDIALQRVFFKRGARPSFLESSIQRRRHPCRSNSGVTPG